MTPESSASAPSRPHLLVTASPRAGLRSVADIRASITKGTAATIWRRLLDEAQACLTREPYVPASLFPGRSRSHAAIANRDYTLVHAVCQRMQNDAVAWLVTGEERFIRDARRQIEVLFDDAQWPQWPDQAHIEQGFTADLRTGQFLRAFGYVYDWLYAGLSEGDRRWLLDNIDRRAIQPYLYELRRNAWFTRTSEMNNWHTCIVGGAGTAAMAFGDEHPDSRALLAYAVELMTAYASSVLGPEGEFNESVAYSAAMHFPIEFFSAYRYHSLEHRTRLSEHPFPEFCRWYMHAVLPPGRVLPFGDSPPGSPPMIAIFLPMAAATREGVFQWFYEQYADANARGDPALELLTLDETVESCSPEGRLPRGRAFRTHSAIWTSRTDWDPHATACVVAGKGGHGAEGHGNHDAGQVCIFAYNEPLIVDLDSTNYPKDFFGPNRWQYYFAGVRGHNILMFDDHEMRTTADARASIFGSAFDDTLGGSWSADLTALYGGVKRVHRTVIHLFPGVVAVLDDAELAREGDLSLRWHTADRCEPKADGRFLVENNGVHLAARVVRPDAGAFRISRGEHEHRPPFHLNRYGQPLAQKRESFVDCRVTAHCCRLLSLFCAFPRGKDPNDWHAQNGGWGVDTGSGRAFVTVTQDVFTVRNEATGAAWTVCTSGAPQGR